MPLTAEQKALFESLTQLQQEIVTNILSGMKAIDAYRASSGKAKTESAMSASVNQILENLKVKELLKSVRENAVSEAIMTREEALKRLTGLARTSLSDLVDFGSYDAGVDEQGNAVAQSTWTFKDAALQDPEKIRSIAELTAGKDGIKIKQHSPMVAIKQLSELQGWNAAAKVEHTGKDGGPIETKDLSENDIARRVAFLLTKASKA